MTVKAMLAATTARRAHFSKTMATTAFNTGHSNSHHP